jgi:steroid 5-alpha reductase family enzyme
LIRTYLVVAALTFVHSVLWFAVALRLKRNDVADVAWGLGFLLAAAASYALNGAAVDRGLLVTALTAVWALRLSIHIHGRNRGKGEDRRYAEWRRQWGSRFRLRAFLQVFLLQWLLMLVVVLPVVAVNVRRGGAATPLDVLGVGVWLAGFVFEAVGDRQLAAFVRDSSNQGRILQTGLWRYSRHPNYFGETAQWWGLALIALSTPGGWTGLIGAAAITFLILKVSGIPLLEESMSRKPGYESYRDRTSRFFPLPPRSGNSYF